MALFRPLNVSERVPEVGDVLFIEYGIKATGEVKERREYRVDFDNRPYQKAYPGFALSRHYGKGGYEINSYALDYLNRFFAYASRADGGPVEVPLECHE